MEGGEEGEEGGDGELKDEGEEDDDLEEDEEKDPHIGQGPSNGYRLADPDNVGPRWV